MKRFAALSLLVTSALFTTALAQEEAPATVIDVLSANDSFSTLVEAVNAAGLTETLSGEGPFTLFAPTNEAFDALPAGELERLLADPEALGQVLSYHVVPQRLLAENFAESIDDSASAYSVQTVQGEVLSLDIEEDTDPIVIINNVAEISQSDIMAGNGVVHVIDTVLVPGDFADRAPDTMSGSGSGGN